MKRALTSTIFLFTVFVLTGCGFHLRGQTHPEQLKRHWCLTFPHHYDPLYQHLEQQLKQQGASLSSSCKTDMRQVHLSQVNMQSNPIATSANTHIRQYNLHLQVVLTLSGNKTPTTLNSFRTFTANETQMLGSAHEQRSLEAAMRREMVAKIIDRMRTQP